MYALQPCIPQHGILILCFVSRAVPILNHCPADTNRKKIRQEWSLLVISSMLYFKDNFGIYKGSEIVAWDCADTSVSRDCLSSKENVYKSACLSKLLQKHFFPLQGYVPVLL